MLEPETERMTALRCVLQVFQEKFWREKKKVASGAKQIICKYGE